MYYIKNLLLLILLSRAFESLGHLPTRVYKKLLNIKNTTPPPNFLIYSVPLFYQQNYLITLTVPEMTSCIRKCVK